MLAISLKYSKQIPMNLVTHDISYKPHSFMSDQFEKITPNDGPIKWKYSVINYKVS